MIAPLTTSFTGPRPSFDAPPVVEVILGVQFAPIVGFDVAHYGLFWASIRDEFPKTESKPPLDPVIESFERPSASQVSLELVQGFPSPRVWFINGPETELIQIQPDRFIFNWRKRGEDTEYPRYEHVKQGFTRHFERFLSFLRSHGFEDPSPNQCEVSYINLMSTGGPFDEIGRLEALLAPWSGRYSDDFLPRPEEVGCKISYVLKDENHPVGRLRVAVERRIRKEDGGQVLRVILTARGLPRERTIGGVLSFFDFGREHVVRGFTSITTPEMHREWRRNDVQQ